MSSDGRPSAVSSASVDAPARATTSAAARYACAMSSMNGLTSTGMCASVYFCCIAAKSAAPVWWRSVGARPSAASNFIASLTSSFTALAPCEPPTTSTPRASPAPPAPPRRLRPCPHPPPNRISHQPIFPRREKAPRRLERAEHRAHQLAQHPVGDARDRVLLEDRRRPPAE